MNSLVVIDINIQSNSLCFGCGGTGEFLNFCKLKSSKSQLVHYICVECYQLNKTNKLMNCVSCRNPFLIDFTQLKINDTVKHGFYEFVFCYNCLIIKKDECKYVGQFELVELEDENVKYWDDFNEEYQEHNYKDYNDSTMRILGKTIYKNKNNEELKNIKKKISNCKKNDEKLNLICDITPDFILNLIKKQNYLCHICDERFLTNGYEPYCCNQFSIDRIDNKLSHNLSNVKISCYFCNCKDHYLYNKNKKECNITICNCYELLK
jgi:hypothetical protein